MLASGGHAGRQQELARLGRVYAESPEHGIRLAIVEGPAGVGRHRLVDAFCRQVRATGATVLAGACVAGEPFAPFATVIADAAELLVRAGRSIAIPHLGCPDGCHALWFQHRGVRHASPHGASDPGGFLERRCFMEAVRQLLEEAGRLAPTVVVLHDLEQADAESRQLLHHLLDASAPRADGARPHLMLMATLRLGDELPDEPLRHHPRSLRTRLEALDEAGLRAVLASPEYVSRILARTGGLPGALDRLLDAELPTPDERLSRRLGDLSSEARGLVDALAVLGAPATVDELAEVAGVPVHPELGPELTGSPLLRAIDPAGRAALTLADAGDGPRLLARLAEAPRAQLHLRAADLWLRLDEPARATEHALSARAVPLAVRLALDAADRLEARHAHAAAAALLERVRDAAAAGPGAPAELHARLADMLAATGAFRAALGPARAALAVRPGEPAAARRVARLLVATGELTEAAAVVERARGAAADPVAALELDVVLAELLYQSGRHGEARAMAEPALAAAASADRVDLELDVRGTLAKLALAADRLDEALAFYAENERRAAAHGHASHVALALGGRGVAFIKQGALREAEDALARCAEIAVRCHDHKAQTLAQHNLAVVAHLRQDYGSARRRYEEALRLLRLVGNRTSLARTAFNLGELYETLGDAARARSMCDFGALAGGAELAPVAQAEGLLLRGRIELGTGHIDAARAAFEAARATFRSLDQTREAAAIVGLARIALLEQDPARAAELCDALPEELAPMRAADAALVRAEIELARGEDATAGAGRAVRKAEAADDGSRVVSALVVSARALAQQGRTAEAMAAVGRASALEAELAAKVPEDLASAWDDRPARRELLALMSGRLPAPRRGGAVAAPRPRPAATRTRLIGESRALRQVLALVERVGPSDCSVLIRGESGTGKELVAEAIHEHSARRGRPLVRVNCAALVETLLLSELFGHERGAFTGAVARKKGRFEIADGGTLFLDEIGDVSPKVQAALLRVLQERRFERVGGVSPVEVDVRVVCATHRDLESMVEEGSFREDLYYRLNGVTIDLPALRERVEDLPALCDHFLHRVAGEHGVEPKRLSAEALDRMAGYGWPGNVRELENVLKAASLFSDGPEICASELAIAGRSAPRFRLPRESSDEGESIYLRVRDGGLTMKDAKRRIERECIERALAETSGNISKAASLLGMKRPRLSQLIKEYGLGPTRGEAS